jgi:hypothetical protein
VVPLTVERRAAGLIGLRRTAPLGYGGWIGDELDDDRARGAAWYILEQLGSVVWIANPYEPRGLAIAQQAGREGHTLVLDLQEGFAAVRGRWSKGHRAAAKSARRQGVTARRGTGRADWLAYFEAYRDSLSRWGRGVTSRYGWPMFDALARVPECELWVAEHEGTIIAGVVCLRDRQRVIYWHAATLERAFPLRPSNLLLETAIADACERGSGIFDLGASGGHKGVEAFKRSFGAMPLASAVVTVDRGLMRVARTVRRAVSI